MPVYEYYRDKCNRDVRRQKKARRRFRWPPSGHCQSGRRVLGPGHGPADKPGSQCAATLNPTHAIRREPYPMARLASRVESSP